MSLNAIVLDTNVLISALLSPYGTARKAFDKAIANYRIVQSELTYGELASRLEKKKFDNGDKTSLTLNRQRQLESIGFRWAEPKGQAAWEKRFNELVAFQAKVSTLWRLYTSLLACLQVLSWSSSLYVSQDWSLQLPYQR